jgi:hypothetical protein
LILTYSLVEGIRIKQRMSTAIRIRNRVFESDKIPSPFILGIFSPRIYIPFGLNRSERGYILRHEFYHIRRKDHLIKLLAFIALTLHWFNPLVWIAYGCMTKDMEMSCDEKVILKYKNISKQYSLSLLSFATNKRVILNGPIAFGEGGIKERVKNVLRIKNYSKGLITFVIGLCCTIIIACAFNPKVIKSGDISNLYGSYAFENVIYKYPASSMSYFDLKEYYTFNRDSFYLVNALNREQFVISYEREEVDEKKFNESFLIYFDIPDISGYKSRYQYTLKNQNTKSFYRIYEMDEEVWLARINMGAGEQEDKESIWTIFKLAKIHEKVPQKYQMNGNTNGVQEFETVLGDRDMTFVEADDTCYNITPKTVEKNSNYRVFKYNKSGASYLLFEDNIYPLGQYFGALGVTSIEIEDLNKDGLEELYFTNSWGSGLHRSNAGYFDPLLKEVIIFDYSYENDELILHKNKDGQLFLYGATVEELSDFAHFSLERTAYVSEIVYTLNKASLYSQLVGNITKE